MPSTSLVCCASNESYAGRAEPYSRMDHGEVSPYANDGTLITPLTTGEFAAPLGSGDKLVQAYNFRLCTTENRSNQVKQKNAIFAPRVC